MTKNGVIESVSGILVDIIDTDPDTIKLKDICTHLTRINRFCGAGYRAYSVAEHTLNCLAEAANRGVDRTVLQAVLVHDFSEAYLGDVSRPLKNLLPEYRKIEDRLLRVICDKYGVSTEEAVWDEVHCIDNTVGLLEGRMLLNSHADYWPDKELTKETVSYKKTSFAVGTKGEDELRDVLLSNCFALLDKKDW